MFPPQEGWPQEQRVLGSHGVACDIMGAWKQDPAGKLARALALKGTQFGSPIRNGYESGHSNSSSYSRCNPLLKYS